LSLWRCVVQQLAEAFLHVPLSLRSLSLVNPNVEITGRGGANED